MSKYDYFSFMIKFYNKIVDGSYINCILYNKIDKMIIFSNPALKYRSDHCISTFTTIHWGQGAYRILKSNHISINWMIKFRHKYTNVILHQPNHSRIDTAVCLNKICTYVSYSNTFVNISYTQLKKDRKINLTIK